MGVAKPAISPVGGGTFCEVIIARVGRVAVTFDEPALVANAGLVLVATLAARLGVARLVDAVVHLDGRVGGAAPGRKVLTLVHAMIAGASHIDHADVLRAGSTAKILGHRVMAPSTLGTFLRSFTFGHVRQLDRCWRQGCLHMIRRGWLCTARQSGDVGGARMGVAGTVSPG